MEMIPKTQNSPVVRTDFNDENAWTTICEMIRRPVADGFGGESFAYVEFIDDPAFRDLSEQQLMDRIPEEFGHGFLMVVDAATLRSPEYPILVIDLFDQRGRSFRAVPSEIQGIENNLSIANMDFAEFAESVDEAGVFRGFPDTAY
jgi:hypothetical protein